MPHEQKLLDFLPRLYLPIVILLLLAQFGFFDRAYPRVGSHDELSEALDGIAIKDYVQDSIIGMKFHNPIAYFEDFQAHTFGLGLKSRPPYFRAIESALFFALGNGIETARLAALLHALAFFAAWNWIVSKRYSREIALLSALLLLASLNFMQYSWRIYTEFAYLLFAILSVHFLDLYMYDKSNRNLAMFFLSLFAGLMAKEIFAGMALVYAMIVALHGKGAIRIRKTVANVLGLFENRLFIPACIATAALAVPWYLIKASTSLFVSLAAGKPLTAESLFEYPLMLAMQEPVLSLCFAAFVALVCFRPRGAKLGLTKSDMVFLSLSAGLFLVVTFASNKEFRYLFFLYPALSLFSARLALSFQGKWAAAAIAAAMLACQLFLSYNALPSLPQISGKWDGPSEYLLGLGSARALYPSGYYDLSYEIASRGKWRDYRLERMDDKTLKETASACNCSPDSQEFFYFALDSSSLDYVIVDTEYTHGDFALNVLRETKRKELFQKAWEGEEVEIYRYLRPTSAK